MSNSEAWLNKEVKVSTFFGEKIMPLHQRLCFLIYANGGLDVYGWGSIGYSQGRHQQGLEQNDAIDLMRYVAYMNGLADAGSDVYDKFKPIFEAYKARAEAPQPIDPPSPITEGEPA